MSVVGTFKTKKKKNFNWNILKSRGTFTGKEPNLVESQGGRWLIFKDLSSLLSCYMQDIKGRQMMYPCTIHYIHFCLENDKPRDNSHPTLQYPSEFRWLSALCFGFMVRIFNVWFSVTAQHHSSCIQQNIPDNPAVHCEHYTADRVRDQLLNISS